MATVETAAMAEADGGGGGGGDGGAGDAQITKPTVPSVTPLPDKMLCHSIVSPAAITTLLGPLVPEYP